MGREVRRVPLDFDWPLRKVWEGFLMPDSLSEDECQDCENGYSQHANALRGIWYGYLPFHPAITGSQPYDIWTPEVRQFAERNIAHAPDHYGPGEGAVQREAQRLADLFNARWCHHLAQEDVDALVAADRLRDFTHRFHPEWKTNRFEKIEPAPEITAREVNIWSLNGLGHDSINAHVVIEARCERDGQPSVCGTCEGHGSIERYPGQRAEAEAWEWTDPPTGDGWQLWETVTEGSPVSPVFPNAEGLAQWMTTEAAGLARCSTIESARQFVGVGWAPSAVMTDGKFMAGTEAIGSE